MATDNQALAEQATKLGYVQSPQEYLAAEKRGKEQAGIKPVDASMVGTTEPIDVPTQKNTSKRDRAMAAIATTPEQPKSDKKTSFGEVVSQSLENIKDPDQRAMAQQLVGALDDLTGGQYSQAGDDILQNLLGAQIDQSKRKKEQFRLQEEAGLPELFAEQALIESNYENSEAARNSRLLNEAGGKTTISKTALANRQAEIQRQYGLQVADNRINELVVAGKINSANILIDRTLDLKYGDLEAEIDLYKSQLEAITPFMNQEQSKLAEQRQFLLNQASSQIQEARDTEKTLRITKVEALKNAQDRGASAIQLAKIQDAQSVEEIASTGFLTSLQERLQTQGLQSQLYTESLKQKALLSDLNATSPQPQPLQVAQTVANVEQLSGLASQGGMSSAVGTSILTRKPTGFWGTVGKAATIVGIPGLVKDAYNKLTGKAQNFIADVEQVRSQLNLDTLINAKANGATFGALSNEELNMLSQAGTKLGNWAVKDDKGNVVAYNASQKDFQKEIDKITNFTKLDAILKGADPASVGVQVMEDGTYWTTNPDGSVTQLR